MDFRPYKIKLRTVQPAIMCAGRDFIECHYRGRIVGETETTYHINFKYKGKMINRLYNKGLGFRDRELEDIKIVE